MFTRFPSSVTNLASPPPQSPRHYMMSPSTQVSAVSIPSAMVTCKHSTRLLELSDLRAVAVLGRGAKGVVFLVRNDEGSGETLALKAMSRSHIENKAGKESNEDAYRRIWLERDVLMSLHHPLLPALRGFVATDKIVGFAMDWCAGGNLSALRRRQTEQMFSDEIIKFYAAELVIVLDHLHKQGIVYRDLKPENILIQESGHIMLVDFDLSVHLPAANPTRNNKDPEPVTDRRPKRRNTRRLLSCFSFNSGGVSPETSDSTRNSSETSVSGKSASGKSNSFVGTEYYLAPEIIRGNGHDNAVDWWGLGVVMYEMLYGKTPFRGQNRKETFYRILTKEPELVGEKTALRDLIRRLLEKEPDKRIECEEIKRHEFFRGVDWEEVLTVARTPFIPVGVNWEEKEEEEEEGIDVERRVEEVLGGGAKEEGGGRNSSKSGGDFGAF